MIWQLERMALIKSAETRHVSNNSQIMTIEEDTATNILIEYNFFLQVIHRPCESPETVIDRRKKKVKIEKIANNKIMTRANSHELEYSHF